MTSTRAKNAEESDKMLLPTLDKNTSGNMITHNDQKEIFQTEHYEELIVEEFKFNYDRYHNNKAPSEFYRSGACLCCKKGFVILNQNIDEMFTQTINKKRPTVLKAQERWKFVQDNQHKIFTLATFN